MGNYETFIALKQFGTLHWYCMGCFSDSKLSHMMHFPIQRKFGVLNPLTKHRIRNVLWFLNFLCNSGFHASAAFEHEGRVGGVCPTRFRRVPSDAKQKLWWRSVHPWWFLAFCDVELSSMTQTCALLSCHSWHCFNQGRMSWNARMLNWSAKFWSSNSRLWVPVEAASGGGRKGMKQSIEAVQLAAMLASPVRGQGELDLPGLAHARNCWELLKWNRIDFLNENRWWTYLKHIQIIKTP